jgi:hypothetical protein
MEIVIERILSHPLLTIALILLCILMLYAVLKRLVKMLAFLAVLVASYFGYVHFFEEDYPLPELGVFDGWKETVLPLLPQDWNNTLLDGNLSGLNEWPREGTSQPKD